MVIVLASILLCVINVVVCGSCPPGKYGAICSNNCTHPHCFCTTERNCDECEAGYWDTGKNCTLSCIPSTCTCTNYSNCLSCKDGSYGLDSKCDKKCSSGCDSDKCYNGGTCFTCKPNHTGIKCDSCVDGIYGENCSLPCSKGCEGNVCNSRDGSCNCSNNYRGEKCESCIESRYGMRCSKPCSPGCVQDHCSSSNGNCECKEHYTGDTCDVCVDGRYGNECLSKSQNDEHTETNRPNFGAAVGGAVGAVLVVIVIAVIVIISKQRNTLCCNKPKDDEQISGEIHTSQAVVFAAVPNNGGEVGEPGRYESLNTSRMEQNDRSDTYTGLFTAGQAGVTEGTSPDSSELDLPTRNPKFHLYANTMIRK